ncbi:Peptidase M16, C-terminal,Metalloenzyme, LuxS/M16 peptidase-like,Peptidase M16, N-terminal [Cinara cedri]|uniref:Peptidase M16, C-terminal,Metalloenzyme, LuxS/M16 peptidase-like,Peptidase M16, N-terminal n=1 Tax=Cinara cedri TaxID=506608 RepID=A0A5E4N675_9HEMI|nr:Peptidase M16, C-terminal,Metalloenzyme, LuxS/M16 peptidase-like,Peptidase M16, N-terminal [Cinara cedri]
MAMTILKAPLINTIVKRCYANKGVALSIRGPEIQTKKLPNNTYVVAVPNYPTNLGRISVTFLSGSRYEDPENTGLTHLLRSSAGLSTQSSSTFAILRNLGHLGANYFVTSDREAITYTIEAHKNNLLSSLRYYIDSISNQKFKPWELSDNLKRLEYDILTISPESRVLDLAHKAAYRNGLGNTVFLPKYNINKLGSEHLLYYAKKNLNNNNAIISGVGVDLDTLVHISEDLNLPNGESNCASKAKYYGGGDIRKSTPIDTTYLAVVTEGVRYKDSQSASFAVLEFLLGKGSSTKWGVGQGVLEQNILKTNATENFSVSSVNFNYSDSGLFGFLLAYNGKDVSQVLKAAVQSLKSPIITDSEVNRAKNQLIYSLVEASESGAKTLENITNQAVVARGVLPFGKLIAAVEAVTVDDVKKVASKVASSKLTLAGYGNIAQTPYLDDL